MSKQYYFKSWKEANYLAKHLECFDINFEVECGINIIDDGYDNMVEVFDEYGKNIAQPIAELIWSYTYEQYELDRKKYIASGIHPRLIMSYHETLAYEEYQAEVEREREIEEAYEQFGEIEEGIEFHTNMNQMFANECYRRLEELDKLMEAEGVEDATAWERFPEYERLLYAVAEFETQPLDSIAAEVVERDELIEFVEMAERTAMTERNVFGCIEFEPQFNWDAKSKPDEHGWSRAVLDIIEDEGASIAESIFELY